MRQTLRDLRRRFGAVTLQRALGMPGEDVEFECVVDSIGLRGRIDNFGLKEVGTNRAAVWPTSTRPDIDVGDRVRMRGRVKELTGGREGLVTRLERCAIVHKYGKDKENAEA